MADGASNSWATGEWASLLAQWWAKGDERTGRRSEREKGVKALADTWRQANLPSRENPWYVQEKARLGGHATLIGVHFEYRRGRWLLTAGAIGDTNLFLLRDGGLRRAFPVTAASGFGHFPGLVATDRGIDPQSWQWLHGEFRHGDIGVIATDAIAEHLLRQHEAGSPTWAALREAVRRQSSFERWVRHGRGTGLADDDSTVMIIERR